MSPPINMLTREHANPSTRELGRGRKLIIDNFAGAGGASEGIRLALGRDPDYAINHSAGALVMHRANHPGTVHLCEDVFHVDPRSVVGPDGRVGLAWFSPDCTHFSAARGSKPVSHRVRGLAWVVIRWVKKLDPEQRPEVIILENVREFLTWGPLVKKRQGRRVCRDKQGRVLEIPDPKRKGVTFKRWKTTLEHYGYKVEYKILDAADYGAPTHRKRLFLIARRDGKPIVWPRATHGTAPRVNAGSRCLWPENTPPSPNFAEASLGSQAGLLPYRTAAECIDWSLPCPSIFLTRKEARVAAKALGLGGLKRPLATNTMRRIAHGLLRYVLRAGKPFIVRTAHGDVDKNGKRRGQGAHDIEQPVGTVTGSNDFAVAAAHLVQVDHSKTTGRAPYNRDIERPLPTIAASNGHAQVVAFLAKHFGGVVGQPIDRPQPTTTTLGTQNQIVAANLVKLRGTCRDGQPVDEPAPTISAQGNHVAAVRAFLVKYYGTGGARPVNEPLDTITAKERMGLVTIEGEDWQIVDIGMRMLTPRELARCQGFSDDYVFTDKTKSDQVARIGNSVPPPIAAAIVAANYTEAL
jgi:DNA (cytosine-5)-methyltransferase 1